MRLESFRAALLVITALALTACSDLSDSSALVSEPLTSAADSSSAELSVASTIGHTTTSVARVSVDARGPFRPNSPIHVTVRVDGLHMAQRSYTELAVTGGGTIGEGGSASSNRWETPLEDGDSRVIEETISFVEPGYYGLIAGVWVRDSDVPVSTVLGDSVLVNHHIAEHWILVDDDGGRFDERYDVSLAGESMLFEQGAVGASRPVSAVSSAREVQSHFMQVNMMATVMSGIVTYLPADSTLGGPRAPVPNALIVGDCRVGGLSIGYISTFTDPNGEFSATCPAGATSYKGTVKLENATHRIYLYNTTIPANVGFEIPANSTDSISVVDDAAKIFLNHYLWNTAAPSLFGRSRGQMVYIANPGVSGTSYYSTGSDRIIIYMNGTWGGWGEFVVSHEYGHAFHYTAIDRWSSYSCVGGSHAFHTVETASCAYVEGFADFFAAVLLRSRPLATQGLNIDGLEASIYRSVGQGIFIEHPFAAVLWDIFDNASTPDSYPGDDDALAMTGSNIAEIMLRCRTHSPNNYLLSHSFEFLYCAEGVANSAKQAAPPAYQYGWSLYGSLSFDGGTPTLPNTTVFRSIWKYALYGI